MLCIKERSVAVAIAPKKKLAMLLVFLISWILAGHGVTHDIISVLRYQPIPIKYAIMAMRLSVNLKHTITELFNLAFINCVVLSDLLGLEVWFKMIRILCIY